MNSIQWRLTLRLALTMAGLSLVAGGSLFAYLRHGMVQEFDHSLFVRAYALQSLVTEHPYGGYDVDVDPDRLPGYSDGHMSEFFCVTDPAGRMVTGSTRKPLAFIGPSEDGLVADGELPNGVRVRALRLSFVPQIEMDERPARPTTAPAEPRARLTVVAARDRGPLDTQIAWVAAAVAGAVALLSLAEVGATVWTVGSGLRTLRQVAGDLAAGDPVKAGGVLDLRAVPTELRPIVQRFNVMLARVAETLSRERRFSADVAHELRTPIAELRSAAEVALRAPDDAALAQRCARQAGEIARQMQATVTTLLAIVRQELTPASAALSPVDLPAAIDAVTAREDLAGRVRVTTLPGRPPTVLADPSLLRGVLENVLGNAVEHGDGPVTVVIGPADGRCELTVDNAATGLTPADLPHLFEPFWRKDAARSGGDHVGLGLTLTRTYCRAMGIDVTAALPAAGRFRITLPFRTAADPPDV